MNSSLTSADTTVVERVIAPERVCYEAHWHDRSVFISAPCQSAREWQWHCLASAILLERLEDACVLAETILESSLQFFVSELPDQRKEPGENETEYMHVLLTCASGEVDIWLPSGAHSNIVRHGELVESSRLRWSCVSASIEIAHVVLDQSDAARLQPGALVLIPTSWQHQWLCTVHVPQFERRMAATINPLSSSIELDYAKSAEPVRAEKMPGQSVVTAILDQTLSLDPSLLLLGAKNNADASSNQSITVLLAQATCRCTINDAHFSADLLQVGEGFGLCIKEYS